MYCSPVSFPSPRGDLGDLGGARKPMGAAKGPKAKIRRCQDDPMRGPRVKVVKIEELSTLFMMSARESREAKSSPALTLQRFGGSGGTEERKLTEVKNSRHF